MSSTSIPSGASPAGVRDLLHLAWPSIASFVCQSSYRVNDQYWVQGLGPEAHAALAPSTFVLVFNFSIFFLSVAGSMSLVARATGARSPEERDRVVRHALALGIAIAAGLGLVGILLADRIAPAFGLEGTTAALCTEYLRTIYWVTIPLALAPLVETIFIAMGDTRVPLVLQVLAVVTNLILNPCLILGWGPFPAMGMTGAALATGLSRTLSAVLGLALLPRLHGVRLRGVGRIERRRLGQILRIGFPSAISISIYAAVYFVLIDLVLAPLGNPVLGGFAIGFNAFEGVAFPVYLGLSIAGSSLVGRNLGAGALDLAEQAVRSLQRVGLVAGLLGTLAFLSLGSVLVPQFTPDPDTAREAMGYVVILAFSQVFVAMEAVHEKVLLGAGHTSPIFWVSVPGNLLRIPLAWVLAGPLGLGAAGVWWAINLSTLAKAGAYFAFVKAGRWRTPRLPGSGAA